jgi:neutral amino acid transport system permease protein
VTFYPLRNMTWGGMGGGAFRRGVLLAALFVPVLFLFGGFGSAAAQEDSATQVIRGRVQNEFVEDGEEVREGVPDVRIVVETPDGEVVAEAVTDEEGNYEIPIEEPGTYNVRLDTETLPDGVTVPEGETDTYESVQVRANSSTTRAFFLGEDLRQAESKLSQLPQTLANGIKLAMIIGITSIGLSLIFGTTGLSNFSHGEMVTLGALVAWGFNRSWASWQLIPAAIAAIVITAIAGGLFELGVWRPLRHRGTSLTSMMIVSIGIALAVRHIYLFLVGGAYVQYGQYTLQRDLIDVGPIEFAPRSLWIIGISAVAIVGVAMFLLRARFGKAIRAVSDNPDLASSSGINSDRVILIVWVLGGALAGLGGVMYGLEYGIRWDMGFTLLLLMFAAITLGGLGNPFGALVGSLVIGIFVELWTWVVPNANDMKNVGALFALIIILLIRPQGILGSKERIG